MRGLAVIIIALLCTPFVCDSANAIPRAKVRARLLDTGKVNVRVRIRQKRRLSRKRAAKIRQSLSLWILRSKDGTIYLPIAQIESPARRNSILDTPLVPGSFHYRALLRDELGRSRASAIDSVYVPTQTTPGTSSGGGSGLGTGETPVGLPTLSSGNSYCPSAAIDQVTQEINQYRSGFGLSALARNDLLDYAAMAHSDVMARTDTLTHTGAFELVIATGYEVGRFGQNIAYGIQSPSALVSAFANSPNHQANMVHDTDKHLGIGCVIDREGTYWWSHNFGRPR